MPQASIALLCVFPCTHKKVHYYKLVREKRWRDTLMVGVVERRELLDGGIEREKRDGEIEL